MIPLRISPPDLSAALLPDFDLPVWMPPEEMLGKAARAFMPAFSPLSQHLREPGFGEALPVMGSEFREGNRVRPHGHIHMLVHRKGTESKPKPTSLQSLLIFPLRLSEGDLLKLRPRPLKNDDLVTDSEHKGM